MNAPTKGTLPHATTMTAAERTVELADHLIAATAIAHDLTLVTRNTGHFTHTGVRLLNPFA